MTPRQFYLCDVLPRLDACLTQRYPHVSLSPRKGFQPLDTRDLTMLVGLTGCGKSTTLARLGAGGEVPSRREVADWIAIPYAQAWADEALQPVPDRVRRFEHTRRFAELAPGGMAAAFSWLYLRDMGERLLLTEGLRGDKELRHALRQFPRWRIIELALPPLLRLRRLSSRQDRFDQAHGDDDLAFLPAELQDEARGLLRAGEINRRALAIMRAEACNYGVYPFAEGLRCPNYQRLDVAGMSPGAVAAAVREMLALPCRA